MRASTSLWCALCLVSAVACGGAEPESNPTFHVGSGGSTTASGGASGGDAGADDCFENPQTHFEIINACTDAVKISKTPELQGLLPDGELPPLP